MPCRGACTRLGDGGWRPVAVPEPFLKTSCTTSMAETRRCTSPPRRSIARSRVARHARSGCAGEEPARRRTDPLRGRYQPLEPGCPGRGHRIPGRGRCRPQRAGHGRHGSAPSRGADAFAAGGPRAGARRREPEAANGRGSTPLQLAARTTGAAAAARRMRASSRRVSFSSCANADKECPHGATDFSRDAGRAIAGSGPRRTDPDVHADSGLRPGRWSVVSARAGSSRA